MKYARSFTYFMMQGLAWGLIFLHQVIISLVLQSYTHSRTFVILLSILFAFFLTHSYRFWAKKTGLFALGIRHQGLYAGICLGVMAISSGVFSYSLSSIFLLNKFPNFLEVRFMAIVSTWFILHGIWIVAYHLFHFFEKIKAQQQHYWQIEKLLQLHNNEVLQLQINPHFLFNALNAIRALILFDPNKAKQAAQILSDLLLEGYRKTGIELISFQQELAIVEQYIALEQLRFGDKLSFRAQLDASLSKAKVPAGMLLTLIENAVKYGFKQGQNHNDIQLSIEQLSDKRLKVVSMNTGTIDQSLYTPQNTYSGIGLSNLKSRLASYFAASDVQLRNLAHNRVAVEVVWQYKTTQMHST
ncbi:MAG: histidine kinase [Bernardetiaceae bacterium]|nr:histidine kinase [Bernardetiaceae bacterium]